MDDVQRRDRGTLFRYVGFELDSQGLLTCLYDLDGERFEEQIDCGATGGDFTGEAAQAAARLVFLLAGVSYYKAGAPPRIAVDGGLSVLEREFLRSFYVHGLAEFAWRTKGQVDLSDLVVDGPLREVEPVTAETSLGHPLIPFGGGIDSIVVVEQTRAGQPDAALFVASTSDVPFEPIERTAEITGLPVFRARRHLDPKILASAERGYFNGHVPVTGVLSALAVLLAVAHGRDSVVMSNEHSASEPTDLRANGVPVNHQWSKGAAFETAFRAVLASTLTGVDYYSALRPYSELWVSQRFAELTGYHRDFRSCNRAFHIDAGVRLATWCGLCDKCCFIDLILAPYLGRDELATIFGGREPLADHDKDLADHERRDLEPVFRSLLGEPGRSKPLECVGDEGECRRAVLLAAARPDRRDTVLLQELAAYVASTGLPVPSEDELQRQQGEHHLPELPTPTRS